MGYVCIHCHFYQPPRENPSLEAIELQDSAYPYHDWNDRITAECYGPNAASRLLDGEGRIQKIVNNYRNISFNFGPTLLSWMVTNAPKVYEAILEADRTSRDAFSGHGSALAQPYNHMIMPLANKRDKYTQAVWGIRDFEYRFGRKPEGMWLPEAAVDLETLDLLAQLGIKFTVLAPRQASRIRRYGGRTWHDVSGERIDPTMPYQLRLPSRRRISLFFYDGPISRAVAFEGLLNDGGLFARRLMGAFAPEPRLTPQLVHIATDGETYGHHHRHGEMALTYALQHIESNALARITNYAEYLERYPPANQVEIFENSSWSCIHGIERWRSDCGCNSGHAGWKQEWRAPLREALDWLRDELALGYEKVAAAFLKDPWAARDGYIDVILDRSPRTLARYLARYAARRLEDAEKVTALKLLEAQRHAMLMYTSCGWFFDELSGIETVQVIHYAGRALELGKEFFGLHLETGFLERLAKAKSNVAEHKDGAHIYQKWVKPAMVNLPKLTAHYAISSLFEHYERRTKVYCYTVEREDCSHLEAGKMKLVLGHARVNSDITHESAKLSYGVLHFGDHNLSGGVRSFENGDAYHDLVKETSEAFSRADIHEVLQLLGRGLGEDTFSLKLLFRDEQRKILRLISQSVLAEVEAAYTHIYQNHSPLMRFVAGLGIPLPKAFHTAAAFALNGQLRRALASEEFDMAQITALVEEARMVNVGLDEETLAYTLGKRIERMTSDLSADARSLPLLQRIESAVRLAYSLPFEVRLWGAQNVCYGMLESIYVEQKSNAELGDESARQWTEVFMALAAKLSVRVT
jgi:alpha-amylase/alpha-mannosidase (GH57 family)